MAGFGVYQLLQPCYQGASDGMYASRYKEISQVVMAICIQAAVQQVMKRTPQRQMLIQHLKAAGAALVAGFDAISQRDLPVLQAEVRRAYQDVAISRDLMLQCDPKRLSFQARSH